MRKEMKNELRKMPIVRGVASHGQEETALRDVQARWSNRMDCENRKTENP
jgi:hypothetical protein